jgi:putative nucleotidyltransferase with HDIG domain
MELAKDKPEHSRNWSRISDTERVAAQVFDQVTKGFRSVPLSRFIADSTLLTDLYMPLINREQGDMRMVVAVKSGERFKADLLRGMLDRGVSEGFITLDQVPLWLKYINQQCRYLIKDPLTPPATKARVLYDNAIQIVQVAIEDPRLGENVPQGREYLDTVLAFLGKYEDGISYLADVLVMDYTLYSHSVNVALLAVCFWHWLGLEPETTMVLGTGALFHDIGKRNIPSKILFKEGRLDEDEWQIMKSHPEEGFRLLSRAGALSGPALLVVLQHHENLDGSGYPEGLKGQAVSKPSRFIRIIDAYDAITSKRTYKEAVSPFDAITIMNREMTPYLDQGIFKMFVSFLGTAAFGRDQANGDAP